MIYLDHAATSFHKPEAVIEAVCHALKGSGNSGRGAHGVSLEASRMVYQTRKKIADFFRMDDCSRVVFTFNATESLNIAIQGLLQEGDHCITTSLEHNSVLRPLYLMEKQGVKVTTVPANSKGYVQTCAIEAEICPETKAVIMNHASNVIGNVQDLEGVGKLCKKHNLLLILDASQTAGLLPIHLEESGISALCCSGHKSMLGPQGTGILCLADGVMPNPLKVGGTGGDSFSHEMPRFLPEALEAGTLNTHGIAGLSAACDYLNEVGQDKIFQEASFLAKKFLDGVKDLPGIILYGDYDADVRTPIVTLNLRDVHSGFLADELFQRFGIATRGGAHCAPEVHRAFGTLEQGMVRFSFSHFNRVDDIDEAIHALWVLEGENR
ncbi:MAG: aminotransferase class V-fold PLP-dependent enzyme [Peptostreptococcales bacterium]